VANKARSLLDAEPRSVPRSSIGDVGRGQVLAPDEARCVVLAELDGIARPNLIT